MPRQSFRHRAKVIHGSQYYYEPVDVSMERVRSGHAEIVRAHPLAIRIVTGEMFRAEFRNAIGRRVDGVTRERFNSPEVVHLKGKQKITPTFSRTKPNQRVRPRKVERVVPESAVDAVPGPSKGGYPCKCGGLFFYSENVKALQCFRCMQKL